MLARLNSALAASFVSISFVAPTFAQCPDWKSGFAHPGVNDVVGALASFDDGSGPALVAGGGFTTAGDAHARFAARWQDLEWSSLGINGPGGAVFAYAVFDSGSGPELYAAGAFPDGIARWDGSQWLPLPTSPSGVQALTVFDDGNGAALYATGYFTSIGALSANRIAKWNGTSWSALGSGLAGGISPTGWSLTSFDDGSGAALYVGGEFVTAGGLTANGIAKWKNGAWSTLGTGMAGGVFGTRVIALLGASVGAGGTQRLYAAGEFTSAGGVSANRIASWNGASWSPLGIGLNGYVNALTLLDEGAGPHLYVGGGFTDAGGASARCVARWDGSTWSALTSDTGFNYVTALAVHDDGTGPALFAGGDFRRIGSTYVWHIAKWSASAWHPLGRGKGLSGPVSALTTFDDGNGSALYAAGNFDSGNGVDMHYIGRFDGTNWSALRDGFNGSVAVLQAFDDGNGPSLFAGGFFTGLWSGGATLSSIARWDGASWSALGAAGLGGSARAMTVFDDGNGPALYVGGSFSSAGFVLANSLARWNGSGWSDVGGGLTGGSFIAGVNALAVFDDGTGRALYAGGSFTTAGTTPAKHIARWDGQTWSALGSGMDDRVLALTVFDDGRGPALYAGGVFGNAGGTSAFRVARWDGASWSAVGTGLSGNFQSEVRALGSFDDGTGSGPQLLAGGMFSVPYGANLARLAGTQWTQLGTYVTEGVPFDAAVNAFATFDSGSAAGAELYVGGSFQATGDSASHFIARMGCVGTTVPFCFGTFSACPCFNGDVFGELVGCLNSQNNGARLDGTGRVSLANDTLVLSANGMTSATALFVQGSATVALGAGSHLGDGLTCTGGAIVRLKSKPIVAGASSYPATGELAVSTNGLVAAPGMRTYQVMYRDAVGLCTPNTFNFTNAVQVGWTP
jgi:hypothetical protein